MNITDAIYIGVLIATIAPLYAMWLTLKKTSATTYVDQLEARVNDLQTQLSAALSRITDLEAENVRLMRLVMKAKGD